MELHAQGLLGDINGSATGGVVPQANVWQSYSYSFVATAASTNISFTIRNDPSYTGLGGISLLAAGSGTNLLTTSGWQQIQSGPIGTPGVWRSADAGNPPFLGVTSASYWYDGSAAGYGGLTQLVGTTPGQTYTLTFALGSNLVANGQTVDTQVYAQQGLPPGIYYSSGTTYTYTPPADCLCTTVLRDSMVNLVLSTDQSVPTLYGEGTVALGSYTLTVTDAAYSFVGVISGTGNLVIAGGTQDLGGSNTYSGTTTIDPGATLSLSGYGSIAASRLVEVNGTLDVSNDIAPSLVSLAGIGSVVLGEQPLILTGATSTFAGVISGDGSLTVTGGTETLSGVNTYTGTTTIGAGAGLALSGAGSIAASVGVKNDGTFDISASAADPMIRKLSGGGSVVLGARNLVFGVPGASLTPLSVSHPPELAQLYRGSLNCVCGPTAVFDADNSYAGAIGGDGGVTVAGVAQALTGANLYRGGTTLVDAVLGVSSDASLGAASGAVSMTDSTLYALGDLASSRTFALTSANKIYAAGHNVTLAGPITGSGALVLDGGGRVTLSNSNSYTGGTAIQYGTTLAIAADSALGAPSAPLVFEKGILLALDDLSIARPVISTGGGGLVDANGHKVVFSGPLTLYSGLYAIGDGEVLLNGPLSAGGPLYIGSGTFSSDGIVTADVVTVGQTGVLRGTGLLTAPTTVYGRLAPGNSPGTLTFSAPLTLTAGSSTEIDIDGTGTGTGAGNYSRILVTGVGNTATLAGTLVPLLRGITGSATNLYTPPLGQRFTIISADGGLQGSFAALTQPTGLPAGSRFDTIYGPTTLSLVVTPAAYGNLPAAGLAETTTQAAVGRMLDLLRPAAGVAPDAAHAALFDPLYLAAPAGIPAALDALSPAIYGDALMAARETWQLGADAVTQRLAGWRQIGGGQRTAAGPSGTTIWVSGLGRFQHVTGSDEGSGYHSSVGGALAGIDLPVGNDALVGVAAGGATLQTGAGSATADGTAVQFMLYGGWRSDRLFLDAQLGYQHGDGTIRRDLPQWGATAKGDLRSNGVGGRIQAGLRLAYSAWRIEPVLGLTVTSLSAPAQSETAGGVFAEHIGANSLTSVQSLAGVRIGIAVSLGLPRPAEVHGFLGWSHEFADEGARVDAALNLSGATAFSVATAPVGRDAAHIGAGIELPVSESIAIEGGYVAALSGAATSHALTGGVRIVW